MAKVILSPEALRDLESIHEYISNDSEYYADKLIDKIIHRISILENNSLISKVVREFKNSLIREVIEGNYRIIYEILNERKITILRVYHSAGL